MSRQVKKNIRIVTKPPVSNPTPTKQPLPPPANESPLLLPNSQSQSQSQSTLNDGSWLMEITRLKQKIRELESENKKLKVEGSQNVAAEAELERLTLVNKELTEKEQEQAREISRHRHEKSELQSTKKALEQEKISLVQEKCALEEENTRLQEANNNLEHDKISWTVEKGQLEGVNRKLIQKVEQLEDDNNRLHQDNGKLKNDQPLEISSEDLSSASRNQSEIQLKALEQEKILLVQEKYALEEEKTRLQEANNNLEDDKFSWTKEKGQLEEINQQLIQRVNQLEDDNIRLYQDNGKLKGENDQIYSSGIGIAQSPQIGLHELSRETPITLCFEGIDVNISPDLKSDIENLQSCLHKFVTVKGSGKQIKEDASRKLLKEYINLPFGDDQIPKNALGSVLARRVIETVIKVMAEGEDFCTLSENDKLEFSILSTTDMLVDLLRKFYEKREIHNELAEKAPIEIRQKVCEVLNSFGFQEDSHPFIKSLAGKIKSEMDNYRSITRPNNTVNKLVRLIISVFYLQLRAIGVSKISYFEAGEKFDYRTMEELVKNDEFQKRIEICWFPMIVSSMQTIISKAKVLARDPSEAEIRDEGSNASGSESDIVFVRQQQLIICDSSNLMI